MDPREAQGRAPAVAPESASAIVSIEGLEVRTPRPWLAYLTVVLGVTVIILAGLLVWT